jgi:hypothetical protein
MRRAGRGSVRAVVVPQPAYEALRDLVRCREDLRGDLTACADLLLRPRAGVVGPGALLAPRAAQAAQRDPVCRRDRCCSAPSGGCLRLDAARGKHRTTVAVAVARELACFV